ncbi:MAG: ABC transporter substrate-binding protein [Eubacteriales bacterium]
MKKLLLLTLSTCLMLTLASCAASDTSSGGATAGTSTPSTSAQGGSADIIAVMSDDMVSFDPLVSSALINQNILNLIYDRLFQLDENLQGTPYLVTNYEWIDAVTCELTIHDNVTYPTGEVMDTGDVKFSLEHAVSNGYLTFIDEVEIVDATTFIIHCTGAYPALPTALAGRTTYIIQEEYYTEAISSGDWSEPQGSGRYTLGSRAVGDSVTLLAKEDYWNQEDAALNDSLTFKVIPEGLNRTIMVETGEADLNINFATADYDRATSDTSLHLWEHYSSNVFFLGLDNKNEHLSNVLVRQAINYAIDREAVVLAAYDGLGTAHYSTIPSSGIGYVENPGNYSYDLDKAKDLMDQAGYAAGFDITISAWNDTNEKIATVVQAYLLQIGITAEIVRIESSSMMNNLAVAGECPMWIYSWGCYADPDLHLGSIFTQARLGSTNWFRFDDDTFEGLYLEARDTDEAVRIAAYGEVQSYLAEQGAAAPLFINRIFALSNSELQGVQLNTESPMNYHTLHY